MGHVRRVSLVLHVKFITLWHPDVLSAKPHGGQFELEFHVAYDPSETFDPAQNDGLRARVEHVAFRRLWSTEDNAAFIRDFNQTGGFRPTEAPLLQLPRLRTVTVEDLFFEGDRALVEEQLPRLHADGKLRLQTFWEGDALRKAEAAKREKARVSSEKQGVKGAKGG